MDLIGVVARVNTVSFDACVQFASDHVVDGLLMQQPPGIGSAASAGMGLVRRAIITWLFTYLGSILLYFAFAGLDYYVVFVRYKERFVPHYQPNLKEMRREMWLSSWSLLVMAALTTPAEVAFQLGYGKIYHDVSEYGWLYLLVSPILFLVFSDTLIYFIHRGLHHPAVYKYCHKWHHSFIHTTPFAAFAFHPIDGFLQGIAYQVFVFCFPFHATMHLVSLAAVGLWTVNIHDRTTLNIPLVNGAAHHNIHHTTFKSNYGQYFIVWDWIFGTFKDPNGAHKEEKEEDVYGKKNL
ncbi:Lathosterol oxidase [Porphyridium purpureum]|uniref:Lathosterol oxidase n=1 Tax=Porphyridium purpureum TaxID=35688 RepID=A0A5J4YYG5_PORPP|nr:Lathosterol oxidase [Porphyridium purpureum]|eukprot:POR7384..scf208_2